MRRVKINKEIKGIFCGTIVLIVATILLSMLRAWTNIDDYTIKIIAAIIGFSFVIILLFFSVILIAKFICTNIWNMKSCGDKVFDELDDYNTRWGDSKEHYNDMINAINFYYKENGKIDTFVGNDLERLFNRLEFLKIQISTKEHMITCITSIGLSFLATMIWEVFVTPQGNNIVTFISIIFTLIIAILFRYDGNINVGSNEVYNYEMQLLNNKISRAESQLLIDFESEEFLLTKKNALVAMINKCSYTIGKKQKAIIEDIKALEKVNLYVKDISEYRISRCTIGKREGYFVFTANNELVNDQYRILYKILRKHELVEKIDSCEAKLENNK